NRLPAQGCQQLITVLCFDDDFNTTQASVPPAPVFIAGRRRFDGTVVLITGATSGIGRAAAIQFAAEGGKVAFCGRREGLGRQLEQEIRATKAEAIYIRAD